MKANREYELIVRRGGRAPALLAAPGRLDHVEVVEVASGEVVLFWDLPAPEAARQARRLREDLSQLDDVTFLSRWSA